ncbi:MAG: protoheme IX farnesyltransferase [Chloroflexi bacterium]|nr:protoheme IX farnesyltransferase [Chloroflexota bacterium]
MQAKNAASPLSPLNESSIRSALGTIIVLFKLRSVALLVLASIGGALLAADGQVSLGAMVLLIITGVMSSAGASAVNQYIERGQDTMMQRTRRRPLAMGSVSRINWVLFVSVGLVVTAILIALPVNRTLAFFLACGALIYVGIYTLWLKPRTLLNIVLGGAAGSCAVLSGSAAVGNWSHPSAISLALLVFAWTPIHFWSLALAYREDYARARVPMLPVVSSPRASAWWIALHSGTTALSAVLLGVDSALGWLYLIPVAVFTVWLGWHTVRLIATPEKVQALRLFRASNIYLGVVLLVIYVRILF